MINKSNLDEGAQRSGREGAYLVQPVDKSSLGRRALEDVIEEAQGLVRAIGLELLKARSVNLTKIQAGSFFGKGTRAQIAQDISTLDPDLIIINATLSPVQQRNLEKEWYCKVIDRTGLILEIFGERAQTKEGRLQVDLAALEYQKSRLVRSWTHLERQRGGAGFMGGPGERQIEIDRRLISRRITKLEKELADVRRTRDLGRQSRARIPLPIVALVGYTNAGKSTLFNQITKAGVFAEDLPFATLDPTMRKISLPDGQDAILSDTVGFIADLPTHLVEAFKATLEQISYADVIIHVIDASRQDYEAQREDVIQILDDLGVTYEDNENIIEVHNKCDLLDDEEIQNFQRISNVKRVSCCLVSAYRNKGIETLLEKISLVLKKGNCLLSYEIDLKDGKAIAWLYENGQIIEREDSDERAYITASVGEANAQKFSKKFGYPAHEKKS
ncbi:MAG: GTPase HflX [Alphaproteobacteria bacterium]